MSLPEELGALFESLPDPLLVVSEAGEVVAANALARQTFGYEREEILARTIGIFIRGLVRRGDAWDGKRLLAPCVVPSDGDEVGLFGVSRDGSEFPVRVHWSPWKTAGTHYAIGRIERVEGRVSSRVNTSYDGAAEFFQAILDELPVIVAAIDELYQVVAWNREAEKMSGYSAAELVGNPRAMEVLMPKPEHRAKLAEVSWVGSDARSWEWSMTAKDGTDRVLAWSTVANAFPLPGWAVWGIAVDITERKQAEEALRESEARLQHAQQLARLGRYELAAPEHETWSREAQQIFGREEGRLIEDVVHPDDRSWVQRAIDLALKKKDTSELEFRIVRPDGGIRHVQSVVEAIDGKLSGTVLDVTERTLIAEARARLVDAQEEERRRLTRELHDVTGHRLTALRLGLRTLAEDPATTESSRRVIADLQTVTDRTAEDMRRLAWELRPPALDELGLVAATRWLAEMWSRSTGVATEFDAVGLDGERLPAKLEIAIYRIVQEALTNVAKHAAAKRVQILLSRQPGQVLALVEDDGHGFDPTGGPPGMGLSGMGERAAHAGGTLDIESSLGGGARVFARFPLTGPQ